MATFIVSFECALSFSFRGEWHVGGLFPRLPDGDVHEGIEGPDDTDSPTVVADVSARTSGDS